MDDSATMSSTLPDLGEDTSINVYKYFDVDGHYGTLIGIKLDGIEAGDLGADITVISTGGADELYGITSTTWLTDDTGSIKHNEIGVIAGNITLSADDASLMIAVNAQNTNIEGITGTISITNGREDYLDGDNYHTGISEGGSYGVFIDANSAVGFIDSTITVDGTASQAFGIYSLGSVGDITGTITVDSINDDMEEHGDHTGTNAWGVDIESADYGNIDADITVNAYMDATGIKINTGGVTSFATGDAPSISGTITVSSTLDTVYLTDETLAKHEGDAHHATGISLYDFSNISEISADITVTANEGDARGIIIYSSSTNETNVGLITSTINVATSSDGNYTTTDGTTSNYISVGIRNDEETLILNIGDGASITANGAGDNYGINNNGSSGIMFSGSVDITAEGGLNNYSLHSNTNLTVMQSSTIATEAKVSLTGDIYTTGSLTFDSGSYTLTAGAGSDSVSIDANEGVIVNQYSQNVDSNGVIKTGVSTSIKANSVIDFNNETLSFYITEDLDGVLITVADGADLTNLNNVQVILSNDYYTALMDECGVEGFEELNFTVIGFENTDDIATSNLETVSFSLMYYDDNGILQYYQDTEIETTEDSDIAIFSSSSSPVLYGADTTNLGEPTIPADTYSYYVGKYAFVADAESQSIPEPSTATLSLLALAGLCVRRRRKA